MKKVLSIIASLVLCAFFCVSMSVRNAEASGLSFSISPMKEIIILEPGEEYEGYFTVNIPLKQETEVGYTIEVKPFYVDDEYSTVFEAEKNRGQMAEWITLKSPKADTLQPNQSRKIEYKITVPEDAPAGGQYASINVIVETDPNVEGVGISERVLMGHLIFAEVAGGSEYSGEIVDVKVPSFLFGGEVRASSLVRNTGNVHAIATYKMKVSSVFGGGVVYDNSAEPDRRVVVPDRTFFNENYWQETPMAGIFNVEYTVEFQGLETTATKVVIVCPPWLLFLVLAAIIILVIRIVTLVRAHKAMRLQP